jgi:hypothetical protein
VCLVKTPFQLFAELVFGESANMFPNGKGVWGTGVPQLNCNAAHLRCSRLLRLTCGVKGSTLPGFCLQMSFFPSNIVKVQRSHPAIHAPILGPWAAGAPTVKFGSRKENAVSPINRTFLKRPKKFPDARHLGGIQNRGLRKGQGCTRVCVCSLCFLDDHPKKQFSAKPTA